MNGEKGFSLIELLIVVVITGIIAAIAIPNLLAARRSANEGSALSALRTYYGAQMTYATTYGGGNYAGSNAALTTQSFSDLASVYLIDSSLGTGLKSGYNFIGAQVPRSSAAAAQFTGYAYMTTPSGVTATGSRVFSIGMDGLLYSGPYGSIVTTVTSSSITSTGGTPLQN